MVGRREETRRPQYTGSSLIDKSRIATALKIPVVHVVSTSENPSDRGTHRIVCAGFGRLHPVVGGAGSGDPCWLAGLIMG